jgi:hypothetical protein
MQSPPRLADRIQPPCLRSHPLRIKIGECIQLRIQPLNLPDVSLGQFHNRDFAPAQHLNLPNSRAQHQFAQWRLSQSMVNIKTSASRQAVIVLPPPLA